MGKASTVRGSIASSLSGEPVRVALLPHSADRIAGLVEGPQGWAVYKSLSEAGQMYATDPTVLELVALLKAHRVRDIVISPGSRHYAFTRSFENDEFFTLHSVVDERSAGFYALGLIQAHGAPAAVICTSGTASVNYGSAMAEAYYQNLPLIAITTDRLPEFLGQMEDQMFDQRALFEGFTKFTGQLRPIVNERDRWYCNRVINEALLTAREDAPGPVHLNMPIESHSRVSFTTATLPRVRLIHRHTVSALSPQDWENVAARLQGRKVLVVWGQSDRPAPTTMRLLSHFSRNVGSPILSDHLANVHSPHRVANPLGFLHSHASSRSDLRPDIVITFGGNLVFKDELKRFLGTSDFEHWRVHLDGKIADPFRRLTHVFAVSPDEFLSRATPQVANSEAYARSFLGAASQTGEPDVAYGELRVVGEVLRSLPDGSALHIANSAPIRMANLYAVDESIDVFCNRGVNGIDGCMSTAIGYAVATGRPTYLLIGDLTFFYDMNSLWIRHLPRNLRIVLVNNEGGAVMHSPLPREYQRRAGVHVSAAHAATARGWVESLGIGYFEARDDSQVSQGLRWLTEGEAPRVLEVFTEKVSDIAQLKGYYAGLEATGASSRFYRRLRRLAARVLRHLRLR